MLRKNQITEGFIWDKMNKRHQNRIDIFMEKNIKTAKKFGVQEFEIFWLAVENIDF